MVRERKIDISREVDYVQVENKRGGWDHTKNM